MPASAAAPRGGRLASLPLLFLFWSCAPASGQVTSDGCQCKFYRCTHDGKEHVYDVNHFKQPEEQWCIQNQTKIYTQKGDCLYSCYDCKDNVCTCLSALGCDSTMAAASVACFVASALALCCGARSCWRAFKKHYIMDEEEAEFYAKEKMEIAARRGPRYVTILLCTLGWVLLAAGIGFAFARQLFG
mmetsp:Transcript_64667/g.187404  ORF Transcript_64667/g.187404 Transcript_64667/m.187404 type:complete len:187 (+) Transcript_64667:121-681(+)